MSRMLLVPFAVLLAVCSGARGQAGHGKDAATWVAVTASLVHNCILAEDLLRKVCARAAPLPQPEKNGRLCTLPSQSFESRTAHDYAEYKAFHRATFTDHAAMIARTVSDSRATFEQQHSRLRSGPFSLLDLDKLHGEVADCAKVAPRLLSPALRKK